MKRLMRVSAASLLAFLAAGAIESTALAQSEGFDEMVVTARRRAENLQRVPVAVTALDGAQLIAKGVTEVNDIELAVPGLQVGTGTFRKSTPVFRIRGFSSGGLQLTEDSAVGFYFAEAPITSPVGQNQAFFDLEGVEVLKGPQGTLFGRNSTGGAVLVKPKRPGEEMGGYIKGKIGNYEAYGLEAAVNLPLSDDFRVRAAVKRDVHDGYWVNIVDGEDFDDLDAYSGRFSAEWDVTDRLSTYLVVDYNSFDMTGNPIIIVGPGFPIAQPNAGGADATTVLPGGNNLLGISLIPGYYAALTTAANQQRALGFGRFAADFGNGVFRSPAIDKGENWGVTNHITFELTDNLTLKNVASFRRTTYLLFEDIDGSTFNALNTYNPFEASQFSEELQLQGESFGGKVNWIAGIYYFQNEGSDNSTPFQVLGQLTPPGLGALSFRANAADAENKSYAGFFQFDWKILENLTFTGGARYTYDSRQVVLDNRQTNAAAFFNPASPGFNFPNNQCLFNDAIIGPTGVCQLPAKEDWQAPSYNVTLSYQVTEDVQVYAAHRQGYRTGSFAARGTDLIEIGPFDKETVRDVEVGVKSEFELGTMPVRFNVAAFRAVNKDIFISIPKINSRGLLVNVADNQGSVTSKGVEVESMIRPFEGLDLTANFAWLDMEFGEDFPDQVVNSVVPGVPAISYRFAGNRPGYGTPQFVYSFGGTYELPLPEQWGEFAVTANYYRQSKSWDPTDIKAFYTQEGYGLLNARVDWRSIGGSNLDFGFFVDNATNTEYSAGAFGSNGDGLGFISLMPADPRTYGAELTYRFGADGN